MVSLLTLKAIVAFSEQCEANLVYGVLLLYSVVSSALKRKLLVAAREEKSCKAALSCSAAAINFMDFELTITVDHFPLCLIEIES